MEERSNLIYDAVAYGFSTWARHIPKMLLLMISFCFTCVASLIIPASALLFSFWGKMHLIRNQLEVLRNCSGPECLSLLQGMNSIFLSKNFYLVLMIFLIVQAFLMAGIFLGYKKVMINLYDTGKVSIRSLFSCMKQGPKLLIAHAGWMGILSIPLMVIGWLVHFGGGGGMAAAVLIGLVLGVVSWIAYIRFSFISLLMADKNVGIVDSFRYSWRLTSEHAWSLFGLMIILGLFTGLVQLVGPIGSIIHFFIIFPAGTLAYVYAYRKLLSAAHVQ